MPGEPAGMPGTASPSTGGFSLRSRHFIFDLELHQLATGNVFDLDLKSVRL
jgi:hypothetical protein